VLAHNLHELRAKRAAGETGFTLVELLVVVVIIVALAAIAVPIFLNQKGKADEARLSSDATSAGKVLAGALSQGSAPEVTCGSAAANTTGGTAGPCTLTFTDSFGEESQSMTTESSLKVVGWDATDGEWDSAIACVQVSTTATDADQNATNTFHYKIQGGSNSGKCA
jgi:prepilin-type N-terminal cleavage/methylation domain-containing protein